MLLAEIMTRHLVSVRMDDTLSVVRQIFDHTRFHHLLVMDGTTLMGVVSDRDLLKALSPLLGTAAERTLDRATLTKRVHQVMTRKPVTLTVCDDLDTAVETFRQHAISCIPILDDGEVVGIVSWRDLLNAFSPAADTASETING